ncbi:MAG: MBL fold metallo-hydrolase [Candidatus Omnitrophota bacterium]|nr:MAG: MBL fold metallo-hydrolase [Candidatus Omnitrophota bacterium]
MDDLVLKTFVVGDLFTNCYLIYEKGKKGFIIDVPPGLDEVKDFIQKQNLDISFCLITHAHFDHIGGLEEFPGSFYVHPEDVRLLSDAGLNFSSFLGEPFVVSRPPLLLNEGNSLSFDNYSIEIIHTPGHTPGSVSLKLGNWLFCGDTIFCGSIGRTDIPLASSQQLLKSINEKIMKLPEATFIYPGHGPSTTVGAEKESNPFL